MLSLFFVVVPEPHGRRVQNTGPPAKRLFARPGLVRYRNIYNFNRLNTASGKALISVMMPHQNQGV
jgi:hypothetical protein